jgi:alpha-amylase
VAFNRDPATLMRTFETDLPAGTYCDVANGDLDAGSCTGPTYTVDSAGRFTASVPPDGMIALHVGARPRR